VYNALPKNERSFSISLEGDTTSEKFEGQFVAKCVLTMAEKHSKELEKTRILADYANPSASLAGIAEILSTIRTKLIKWPDWWANLDHGSKILDENIIILIYDQILSLERDWKDEIRKKVEDTKTSNKEAPQGNC